MFHIFKEAVQEVAVSEEEGSEQEEEASEVVVLLLIELNKFYDLARQVLFVRFQEMIDGCINIVFVTG